MAKADKSSTEAAALVQRAYSLQSKDEQHALYRDWAGTYDDAMVGELKYASPRKCAALLASHLPDKHTVILDIGCGTGLAGQELASRGYTTIDGIDISQDMLDVAAQRQIYRNLQTGDLLKTLKIDTGSYGGAICTGTFTHAHVGASCLDEITRIMRPGAVLAFTVHRDVHKEMGFDKKLGELQATGILKLAEHRWDTYYDGADDTKCHFYVFAKQ